LTGGLLFLLGAYGCRTVSIGSSSNANEASASSGGSAPAPRDEGRLIRNLRVRAAHDLGCPEDAIEIKELAAGTQAVNGCGKRTTYLLTHQVPRRWVMNSEIAENKSSPSTATRGGSSGDAQLTSKLNADGKRTLTLTLPRGIWGIVVKLQARPADYPDRALLVLERPSAESLMEHCEPRIVLDGNLLAAPASVFRKARSLESRSLEMSLADIETLADAQRAVADVCGKRIELGEAEIGQVRQFLVRFKEELALSGGAPSQAVAPQRSLIDGQESL
jgi:hypothetical protein